jgi:coenzyme F420 hydrogenase subunit beta
VRLVDFVAEGIRRVGERNDCGNCQQCLDVCPAVQTDLQTASLPIQKQDALTKGWGRIRAIWEGHANVPEIRFKGASGGVLTAMSAYYVEKLGMHGVLHIAQNPDDSVRNRTHLSRSREDLLAATGSRYSPAP